MCTRYISPDAAAIERHWHVGRDHPWRGGEIFPNYLGAFIRAARASTGFERELVVGQWSLIPWFATERKQRFPTCNARSEEMTQKASYKQPWARSQRCIVPAAGFFEPNWETGKHVPWLFRRADGTPWGLAGLWNTWLDKTTGELIDSYTLLTQNADAHALMRRMHRPDPKLPPDRQDKRSVVPIAPSDVDQWLHGTPAQAVALIQLPAVDGIDAVASTAPGQSPAV